MQKKALSYRLGRFINKLRWPIIGLWLLAILLCIPFLPHIIDPFKTTGFIDESSSSAYAENYMNKKLGYNDKNKFLIMYHSNKLLATQDQFKKKIKKSLSDLEDFPIKHEIIYPDDKHQISKDKHTAYVVLIIKTNKQLSDDLLKQLTESIKKPSRMTMKIGGEPLFVQSVNKQTQTDLFKADMIAAPVAIITLILVFGSVIAATLPIILGGGCAIIILTTLYFLGHLFTLSIFTINIALLLGLCLCLDYSLFFISRFRDELKNGLNIEEAIATTQETAGKAIFFSGLAVFVSLSALFLFPVNILFSVAVGGLAAVFFAVLVSTIFLPAILAVLKSKINLLSVRLFRNKNHSSCWRWLAERVVRHPYLFFFPILIFLLVLGYPLFSSKYGISDYRIFPEKSENRAFYDTYAKKFQIEQLNPIILVIESPSSSILSRHNLSKIYNLVQKLKRNPRVKEVNGIISSKSDLKKGQYYTLYHLDKKLLDPSVKQLLKTTTTKHMAIINVISKYPVDSEQTKKLVNELHKIKLGSGLKVQVTGVAASNIDVLYSIYHYLPYAILWIMVFSYLILLFLLRSLFLPLKAIVMTLLSLCAAYGALVFIFQEGYFSEILNFQPQGMLDISLLVIIFCALFGFSMDYEVFLLTRIKEAHQLTKDNNKSIIFGIEKSSRIITSAALIVIVICCAFLIADVLMVKAFGLGIAVAIFVDAFLIRSFLVPATMAIFKSWVWYLPKWLDRLLPKL
ncbi:MMPL family transporter [Legionella anisa]|uniref:MMPL family transporter n=1 Tax=Legionella anisa TaxID=28082 RepID=A0AAX0WX54_9GAMM|nr:MMPL family transporter [Legionella anisa]AWN74616.1 MMPL family transporter [Legionella anisa]KTC76224.1 Membrane protein YdfJ [Legionella anisa]MBN5937156.1 MMPL family transporter [Legionella anisa]MCW8425266.1 MMPL family transporter [Legionella anisa]MCW8449304.1 MMPL family transporter [Legionella anisa]